MHHHSKKYLRKKGLLNLNPMKLSKPYSIRFSKANEEYILKACKNRSQFINQLITEVREKEMKQEAELKKWREIIYK